MDHPRGKGISMRPGKRVPYLKWPFTTGGLRITSSIGFIAAQCVFLFHSREVGLVLFITCQMLSFPDFIRKGYWDIVVLGGIGLLVNLAGLIFTSSTPGCS
jgi:hypothetical protein